MILSALVKKARDFLNSPAPQALQRIQSPQQVVSNYFKPVGGQVRTRDVIRELPSQFTPQQAAVNLMEAPKFNFGQNSDSKLAQLGGTFVNAALNPFIGVKDYSKEAANQYYGVAPQNTKKLVGMGLNSALDLGGILSGGSLATKFFGSGKLATPETIGQAIKIAAKQGADTGMKYGAGYGLASSLEQGDSLPQAAWETVKGGGQGYLLGGLLSGATASVGALAKTIPNDIRNRGTSFKLRMNDTPDPNTIATSPQQVFRYAPNGGKGVPVPGVIDTIKKPGETIPMIQGMAEALPPAGLSIKDVSKEKGIRVFVGRGGKMDKMINGTDELGKGQYFTRDPKIAEQFGDVAEKVLNIDEKDILKIASRADLEKFVKGAIKAYPHLPVNEAQTAYAKKMGYKAIEGSPQFDELAGINVIDPKAVKEGATQVEKVLQGAKMKERGFVTSVKESLKTPQSVKETVEGSYVPKSDTERRSIARAIIQEDLATAEQRAYNPQNDTDITIGNELLDHYFAQGQYDKVHSLVGKMAESGTELGRAVHAFADYDKTTPAGAVKFAQRTIDAYNRKNPNNPLNLTELDIESLFATARKIQEMPEGRERNILADHLMKQVNNLIPSTLAEKAITVWKAGLLTSLRTQGRNIIGNTTHGVAEVVKDLPGAAADRLMAVQTGQRTMVPTTRGMVTGIKTGVQGAADMLKYGFDPEEQISKYDIHHITWNDNPVEQALKTYTDVVFRTLGASDKPFYHSAFARSLYSQAGAEAINAGQKGNMQFIQNLVDNPTPDMLKLATQDASVATFKNENIVTDVLSGLKRSMKGTEGGKIISEMFAPFTGVPGSIATQLLAYSPVGLTRGAVNTGRVMLGKGTEGMQRNAAQQIGRGITGTAIMAAGAALMKAGLMTGNPKDLEEVRQWELEGKQPNSVLISGKWRSINSIGPEYLVLLAGGKIQSAENASEAAWETAKDFFQQSPLQGIQRPMEALVDPKRYAKSYVQGQATSIIPNIVKDWAKAADTEGVQRETNDTREAFMGTIPGLRDNLLEKRDVLGQPLEQGGSGPISSFIDVFNSRTSKGDATSTELRRLYNNELGTTPSKIQKKQTIFGQKVELDPKELDILEKESGNALRPALDTLITSPGYQTMSDEQKQKMIGDVVSDMRRKVKEGLAADGIPVSSAPDDTITAPYTKSAFATFDPTGIEDKYQLQIAKQQLEESDKSIMEFNGKILRKNADGVVGVMTKDAYESSLHTAELTNKKKNKDWDGWLEVAKKQYTLLNKQLSDPNTDELDKTTIQNKLDTLLSDTSKYLSYGGNFLKGKSGGKSKKAATIDAGDYLEAEVPKIKLTTPKSTKVAGPKIKITTTKTNSNSNKPKVKFTIKQSRGPSMGKRLA